MGDAGAVVTQDPELAERVALAIRQYGLAAPDKSARYQNGVNSRLDELKLPSAGEAAALEVNESEA